MEAEWDWIAGQYPDAIRPDVERIRIVDLDWAETHVACLQDRGWDAQVSIDGESFTGSLTGSDEAFFIDRYICNAQYPADPIYSRPLNDEQLSYLYWYYSTELRACLEAEGYAVDEPPSEASFVENYHTGTWSPYDGIVPAGAAAQAELHERCPQFPAGIYD